MNRREFLDAARKTVPVVGVLGAIGGVHCGRILYARSRMQEQLMTEADPLLSVRAAEELRDLPEHARNDIATWFHAPCLNAREFAVEICANTFQERLARCASDECRHVLFLAAFHRHIASEKDILDRIDSIATRVGGKLDRNWDDCCRAISARWDARVGTTVAAPLGSLGDSLEPQIRIGINKSLESAIATGNRPALGEIISSASISSVQIGRAAILLMPLFGDPRVKVALFVALQIMHLGARIWSRFRTQKAAEADVRELVSADLAQLADRIGDGLAAELRTNIGLLHGWQKEALQTAADERTSSAISFRSI